MNMCVGCEAYKKCFAAELNSEEIDELNENISQKLFKPGDIIYGEGLIANSLYLIINGGIQLQSKNYSKLAVIMRMAHSGESIGLESLLPNRKYLMTAIGESEGLCCIIPRSIIDKLALQNKNSCLKLIEDMQSEQERIYKHSILMITGNSLSKLAQSLFLLQDQEGRIRTTKEEIALMTGLTRETISRLLSKLKRSKIVNTNKREILIIDESKLQNLKKGSTNL